MAQIHTLRPDRPPLVEVGHFQDYPEFRDRTCAHFTAGQYLLTDRYWKFNNGKLATAASAGRVILSVARYHFGLDGIYSITSYGIDDDISGVTEAAFLALATNDRLHSNSSNSDSLVDRLIHAANEDLQALSSSYQLPLSS